MKADLKKWNYLEADWEKGRLGLLLGDWPRFGADVKFGLAEPKNSPVGRWARQWQDRFNGFLVESKDRNRVRTIVDLMMVSGIFLTVEAAEAATVLNKGPLHWRINEIAADINCPPDLRRHLWLIKAMGARISGFDWEGMAFLKNNPELRKQIWQDVELGIEIIKHYGGTSQKRIRAELPGPIWVELISEMLKGGEGEHNIARYITQANDINMKGLDNHMLGGLLRSKSSVARVAAIGLAGKIGKQRRMGQARRI